jgi:hypothetical protein
MRVFAPGSLACLLLLGCAESDELSCGSLEYRTCDIRQSTCQSLVFDQMRCLRGDEAVGERPRSVVVSEEELRESFASEVEELEVDEDVTHTYSALSVIGLVHLDDTTTDSQVEFQVEGLLGFYSHATKEIVIVDHGEPLDDELATTTLGHEYVHALQDIEFDLSNYRDETSFSYDSALAATSITEGEATLYDGFQLAKIQKQDPEGVDWLDYYGHYVEAADSYAAEERSALLVASSVFPYTYGPFASADIFTDDGDPGLRKARYRDLSTQTFLARPRSSARFAPDAYADDLVVEGIAGRRSLGDESLGAWLLHAFAVRVLELPVTPELALGWRGDAVSVFYDESSDASELVWKIRWSRESEARAFADRVASTAARAGGTMTAFADGDSSVLVASSLADADLGAWLEALSAEPETDASSAKVGRATPQPDEVLGQSPLSRALGRFHQHCVR